MTKFALVVDNLNSEEARKLYNEAQNLFETLLLTDLSKLLFILERDNPPKVLYDGNNISDINILMIRSSRNNKVAKSVLAHIFHNLGANIIDSIERFPIGFASKLLSTISRHKKNCTTDTYLPFSRQATANLISYLNVDKKLLIKPINSSQSRGIEIIENLSQLRNISNNFSFIYKNDNIPLYIQTFINIDKEYRMFMVNGKIIASMKKIRGENGGIKYKRMRFARLAEFVVEHVSKTGVLGIDACQDTDGNFYIIEANRSPMFHYLEDRTGINISREIFNNL